MSLHKPKFFKKIGDFFAKTPEFINKNRNFFITGLIAFTLSIIVIIILLFVTADGMTDYIDNIDTKNIATSKSLQSQINHINTTIADTIFPYISFLNQERLNLDSNYSALAWRVDSTKNRLDKFIKKNIHDNKYLTKYIASRDGFKNPDSLANFAGNICMNVYGRMIEELQKRVPAVEPKGCDEPTKVTVGQKNIGTSDMKKINITLKEIK